jgi:tetratricopeptide (TPR) repeat protein
MLIALFAFTAAAQTTAPPASGEQAVTVQGPQRPSPPPPDASPAQLERTGDELRAQKFYDDAIDHYTAALRTNSSSAVLRNKIGIAHLQMARYDHAQKEFKRAIKANPQYAEAHNNLGVVHYKKNKYKQAIREYQTALQLSPDSASFHSNLAAAYFARKEYDKATAHYLRAIQIDPEIFERQSHAGIAARMASPEDRARYAYILAKLWAKVGDLDRSLQYLKKAVEEGYPGIGDVYKDAEFTALRNDPRFAEVMARKEPLVTN